MKTFESRGHKWISHTPESPKPEWLPDDALVRHLYDAERDGHQDYVDINESAAFFFGDPSSPDIEPNTVGWYPVEESLVPATSEEPLKLIGTIQTPRKAIGVMSRAEMLAEVERWMDDTRTVVGAEYDGAYSFVNWYYDQCEDEGGVL